MGITIKPKDPEYWDIEAETEAEGMLTSISRQDSLFDRGFCFEASAAQAFLVDALLRLYFDGAVRSGQIQPSRRGGKDLESGQLTMGRMVRVLVEIGGFHDSQLAVDLTEYVAERNSLAHKLALDKWGLSLYEFYKRGRKIALVLWYEVLKEIVGELTWSPAQQMAEWEKTKGHRQDARSTRGWGR